MLKNKLLLFLLLFVNCLCAQTQKTDTIYVYEEVIIRDTVYIERPLAKLKIDKIVVTPEKKGKKAQITIIQNNKKTVVPIDSLEIQNKKNSIIDDWKFGSKIYLNTCSNTLLKEFNADNQFNAGVGFFVRKTLFHNNFSIGTGIEGGFTINPNGLNNAATDSYLNGYYFAEDGSPLLFNSISSKGFQLQIPLQFYWKIKKFTPSIGVFGNLSNYESTFIGSSGNLPISLDETQKYSSRMYFIGYLAQLEYSINKNLSVALNYYFSNANNIVFRRDKEAFSVSKKLTQNSFGTNLLYHF